MSVMDVLKKDLGGKKKKDAAAEAPSNAAGAPAVATTTAPAKARKAALVALASSPRANLLPPEIGQNEKKRAVRSGLRLMVVAALVLSLGASAGAVYLAITSQLRVVDAQAETQALSQELTTYAEVKNAEQSLRDGEAALAVGGSTDIDWQDYLTRLQGTLPEGVVLTDIDILSADAQTPYEQSQIPLEQRRIATLSFTAESAVLPSIPSWIDGLSGLPGFADASPSDLTFSEGVYTATVTMHINEGAFSGVFTPNDEETSK